jgi:hypothetical protein
MDVLSSSITDPSARERAQATTLEMRWMDAEHEPAFEKSGYARIERDYADLAANNSDNDLGASISLSYAEFAKLRSKPDLDEAMRRAHFALDWARDSHLALLELWARVELLDLGRLQGQKPSWTALADQCEMMRYPIALAYALTIAKLAGETVRVPDHLAKFLSTNRFHNIADLLTGRVPPLTGKQPIRLALPGLFTVY